jgi:hypothetical protein
MSPRLTAEDLVEHYHIVRAGTDRLMDTPHARCAKHVLPLGGTRRTGCAKLPTVTREGPASSAPR